MSQAIQYLDTTSAYDLWSEVYDKDGNFLQALDTIEMKHLLPKLLQNLEDPPWKIIDLGCGTGRNTSTLLSLLPSNVEVIGLDASPKMLEIAKRKLENYQRDKIQLEPFDILQNSEPPQITFNADAVISTLVIEHVPVDIFFNHINQMLKSGGICLLTNMHSEMGKFGQAGFIDPKTGEKIRPKSYIHTIEDIKNSAMKYGFEIIDDIEEKGIDDTIANDLGPRAKKWIGITVWFGGLFRKK